MDSALNVHRTPLRAAAGRPSSTPGRSVADAESRPHLDPTTQTPTAQPRARRPENPAAAAGARATGSGRTSSRTKLGEGVSCFVFRGWDERPPCPVALKIVNWANVYDRPAAMRQMRTEAAALARVKHPRVVRFIDFGFDPRWPYLVTEFFEGRPLGELLRAGGALPPEWALYLISQMVGRASGRSGRPGWSTGTSSRTTSWSARTGSAKLIDFGLAKADALQATARADRPGTGRHGRVPRPGAGEGRQPGGPPGGHLLARRDVLRGAHRPAAVRGPEPRADDLPTPEHAAGAAGQRVAGRCPPLVSDLCLWMLAKNPAERPQNYDELRQAFDTVIGVSR